MTRVMFTWIMVLALLWIHVAAGGGRSMKHDDKERVTCNKQIDLGIILDASASTGRGNFRKYKQFAKQLLSRFDISPAGTHVALSYFSVYHHIVATFNKSHTLEEAQSIIDNMFYENSVSKLSNAIMEMHFEVFSGNNSGVRPKGSGSKMAAVFITDGFSSAGYELTSMRARSLHDYGVEAFAVYPNGRVHRDNLLALASKPTTKHLFKLEENQKRKSSLIDKIVKQICFGSYSKK